AGPEAGGPAGAETTENAGDPAAAGTAQAEVATVVPPDGTDKAPIQWTILNPLESIVVQIKLAIYTALVVSLPIILWQVCAFIFPGLHKTERRVVQVLIFGCSILATVGVLIAYFGVFP